jgi:hypothetical protein
MTTKRTRDLAGLAPAELARVGGGSSILLPALGQTKEPAATGPALEEISIAHEGLVRVR